MATRATSVKASNPVLEICKLLEELYSLLLDGPATVQTCKVNQKLTALFFNNDGCIKQTPFRNSTRKLLKRLYIAAGCLRVAASVPNLRGRAEMERLAVVAGYVEIYANYHAQR